MVVISTDSAFFLNYEQKVACKYPGRCTAGSLFKETFPGEYTHRVVFDLMQIIAIEVTFSSEVEETAWVLKWL